MAAIIAWAFISTPADSKVPANALPNDFHILQSWRRYSSGNDCGDFFPKRFIIT